jgi:hypothetical protein
LPETEMTGQGPGENASDAEADRIYLDIRSRILNGQFLPEQVVEWSAIVTHFSSSRTVVDQALEALVAEGYLRQTLRGGYVVTRYSPGDVEDTLILLRIIASAGVRSLIREPDPRLSAQLQKAIGWSADFKSLGPYGIETITQRARWILNILMDRATKAGIVQPLKTLTSPALHRQSIRCMTTIEIFYFWGALNQIALGVLNGDLAKAQEPLLAPHLIERSLADTITQLNGLPASHTADFSLPAPEFHILFRDAPDRPYFGLGEREHLGI